MHRPGPTLALAVIVIASGCSGYVADTSITPGNRVRVTAPSLDLDESVGTVDTLESDTLVVAVAEGTDAARVPLTDVTSLEVSRGTRSHVATGAAVGTLGGLLVGAVFAVAGCGGFTENCTELGTSTGDVALVTGGIGAGAGLVLGIAIGAAVRSDRWEAVALDDIRVGLSPVTPNAVAAWVALRL